MNYWDHAFITATFLINRLPSISLNNLSPYALLMHKSADYSCLRVFGCACFPFLRPCHSHKLDFRTQECVFLGYSSSKKGYKCLAENGTIYISKDVLFHDSRFPFLELFSTSQSSTSNPSSSSCYTSAIPLVLPPINATPLHQFPPDSPTVNQPIPTPASSPVTQLFPMQPVSSTTQSSTSTM